MEHVTIGDLEVPALGIGTVRFESHATCRRAVETALDVGYRRVDTARKYGTERAVGDAISAADPDRDEVFVTTKLETENRARERVLDSTRRSVEKLRTDSVDLLLVHSPNDAVPIEETVEATNDLQRDGVVRHVGVSNFSIDQLRGAIDGSETLIVANQVEYSPYRTESDLLAFCTEENIMLTAYSPLALGRPAEDSTLAEIVDRYGKTAAGSRSAGSSNRRWFRPSRKRRIPTTSRRTSTCSTSNSPTTSWARFSSWRTACVPAPP